MHPMSAIYSLAALFFLVLCDGLEEHTGKLLFHSADNDPKDQSITLIEVQRFFLLFDLNGDGDIKGNEFVLAWRQHFGLSQTEAKGLLALVDQFEPKDEITEIEITSAYNKMDKDNKDSVTEKEFLKFWGDLNLEFNPKTKESESAAPSVRKMYRRTRKFRRLF